MGTTRAAADMTAQLGRFLIRDFTPWDGGRLFRMTGDPVVTKYMGFRTHENPEQAARLLETYGSSPTRWQAVCVDFDPSDVIGMFGLEVRGHSAALTIMFRNDRKARGAGRELSVPLVQWIFTHPQVWRVWAYCHVDNVPVQRVLERMGAVREGLMRRFEMFPNISDEPQDCYLYAIARN